MQIKMHPIMQIIASKDAKFCIQITIKKPPQTQQRRGFQRFLAKSLSL